MDWLKVTHKSLSLIILVFTLGNGQSFGKQKVQYEQFDFHVIHSSPFAVYYYPSEIEAAKGATGYLHYWLEKFEKVFKIDIPDPQHIIFYANHADFQQTTVTLGQISQGTGGFTEGLKSRIVMPLTGICSQDKHVVGHELVHVYHFAHLKKTMPSIPLWVIEGMAEYLSVGHSSPLTSMWLRDDVINKSVPTIQQISRGGRYFPYRYGHAVWSFLAGHFSDTIIEPLFESVIKLGLKNGMERTLSISMDSLSDLFQDHVYETHTPTLKGKINPSGYGSPLIIGKGGMNIAPSVSPDGKYVTFFSRRDVFSLSLYLANMKTGRVIKKLLNTTTNPYFDALSFINSTGAWSPDSKQFALITFDKGDNSIAILDIENRDIVQEITLSQPEAITALSWSPDGKQLAISGTMGAINDLYLYTFETYSIEKITHSIHAEIQPAWSPDGSKIAFATDRFGAAHPDSLADLEPKIGIMDITTKEVEIIGFSGPIKHINPHFSKDGKSVYFVADPDGVSNIFRYDLEEDTFFRLTDIATSISGLSELASCFSMSANEQQFVFNVFDRGQYNIYSLSANRMQETSYVKTDTVYGRNTHLFPLLMSRSTESEDSIRTTKKGTEDSTHQDQNRVASLQSDLKDTTISSKHFATIDSTTSYDPRLKLLSIGDISFGFSANQYGALFGGSASMLFGDILGIHRLGIATQVLGDWRNISLETAYLNIKNRINWGVGLNHVPYETVFLSSGIDTMTIGSSVMPVDKIELVTRRTFLDQLSFSLEYPLSAQSRFEISPGYTFLWYQGEGERIRFLNGQVIDEEEFDPTLPEPLSLFQSSFALVGDYTIPGFTAPIEGWRYRIGLETTTGSLTYLALLFDYRHYFFLRPFTFALRGVHYGRYFKDAENDRLSNLSLGFASLVRGYESSSFSAWDCTLEDGRYSCPEVDRLSGSRIAVGNAELRIPLLGVQGMGLINAQFIPTNLVGFFDIGVAWNKDDYPKASLNRYSRKRIPITSAGIATRSNLAGLLIFQLYFAYPFQRANREWQFGFLLEQGW